MRLFACADTTVIKTALGIITVGSLIYAVANQLLCLLFGLLSYLCICIYVLSPSYISTCDGCKALCAILCKCCVLSMSLSVSIISYDVLLRIDLIV